MKSTTTTEIIQTTLFTFKPEERKKVVDQCVLLNLTIMKSSSIEIVASRVITTDEVMEAIKIVDKG